MNATINLEKHFPVLLNELISIISPLYGGTFIDCTFGAGGYSKKILEKNINNIIAIDRDNSVNSIATQFQKKYESVKRLSGGQQRRVAIARTLAQQPKLILADEFLSELDEKTSMRVTKAVIDYVSASGAAMILVEHDISRAKEISDRLLIIDDGRLNPFITDTSILEV